MVILICKDYAIPASGSVETSQNGNATASLGSPALGQPRQLTIAAVVDGATTLDFNVSYDDGTTWVPASFAGSGTKATLTFAGAESQAVDITPAPYVQIVSSGAVNLTAWAYTA